MPELLAFAAPLSGLGAPCSSLGDRPRVAIRQAAYVRFVVGLTTEPAVKTGPSPPMVLGLSHSGAAEFGGMDDVNEQSMKLKLQNSEVCDSDEELDREDEMEAEYREAQQQQPPDD